MAKHRGPSSGGPGKFELGAVLFVVVLVLLVILLIKTT